MAEILSPVGNIDSLYAAVQSGADAVYLGAGGFNARRNAKNFNKEELAFAVKFCRLRGVKVYLTLNTLVYDSELALALSIAKEAAKLGIDGVIAADLGLSSLIKKAVPSLPLHASTQLTVHSVSSLYVLKELGFSRVVPAREMSFSQLKEFTKAARELGLEVEVFVHGALCMSMSGQCLMSAFLGARSGNRGLCAGTCRLPFYLPGTDHALSLKDMSYIDHIKELESIGVDSFKIEGRMKSPEYVGAATNACKKALENGYVDAADRRLLEDAFSRSGFTDGYYTKKTGKNMFGFRTKENEQSTKSIQNEIHELYRNEYQRVGLFANFECKYGKPAKLTLSDGKNSVTVLGEKPAAAQNRPTDGEYIKKSLSKLGGTPYFLKDFSCLIQENLYLSAASLNELRRNAAEELSRKRSEMPKIECNDFEILKPEKKRAKKRTTVLKFLDVRSIPKNLKESYTVAVPINQRSEITCGNPVILCLFRGIEDEQKLENELKCADIKYPLLCENLAHIHLAKKYGYDFFVGPSLNTLNSVSEGVLLSLGAKGVIVSYELKRAEFPSFSDSAGIVVYGRTPLMLTKNCPVRAFAGCKNCTGEITDRKGITFPVRCEGGFSQIFNSRPTFLADRLREYSDFGTLVLNFTTETESEVAEIIDRYENGLQAPGLYTRGLYEKGVL